MSSLPCPDLTVILSWHSIKTSTSTIAFILWIEFTNLAGILTGWWCGPGEMFLFSWEHKVVWLTMVCWQFHRSMLKPEWVTPNNMRHYQSTNWMPGPCYLCPLIDPMRPDFMESTMYHATTGMHTGEYVASCTKDKCVYLGEFSCPSVPDALLEHELITNLSANGVIVYLSWAIH